MDTAIYTAIMLCLVLLLLCFVLALCYIAKQLKRAASIVKGASVFFELLKDPKVAKTIGKHEDQIKTYILNLHEYCSK